MIKKTELEERALTITEKVNTLVIMNQNELELAGVLLLNTQLLMKEIKSTFDPIVAKAHATHKEATFQRKKHLDPVEQNEWVIKNKISGYIQACELAQQKEEDKKRAEAEKKEQALKDRAAEALKNGDEKKAEKLIEKAAEVVMPSIAPKYEKPANVGVVTRYRAEITDRKLIPIELNGIELRPPDMKALNKLAQISRGMFDIPGIKIVAEKTISGRTV